MTEKKKIAVIGGAETVLPFKAIGLDCYTATNPSMAADMLNEAVMKNYGIIYIEESYAKEFYQKIQDMNHSRKDTAITIIPGSRGGKGFAGDKIRMLVKRAIGIDIFGEK